MAYSVRIVGSYSKALTCRRGATSSSSARTQPSGRQCSIIISRRSKPEFTPIITPMNSDLTFLIYLRIFCNEKTIAAW